MTAVSHAVQCSWPPRAAVFPHPFLLAPSAPEPGIRGQHWPVAPKVVARLVLMDDESLVIIGTAKLLAQTSASVYYTGPKKNASYEIRTHDLSLTKRAP